MSQRNRPLRKSVFERAERWLRSLRKAHGRLFLPRNDGSHQMLRSSARQMGRYKLIESKTGKCYTRSEIKKPEQLLGLSFLKGGNP